MISLFEIKNYKALRDVSVHLTPMHILIGPNNSGKSSILDAVQALHRSVEHRLDDSFPGRWDGAQLVWKANSNSQVTFGVRLEVGDQRIEYSLGCQFAERGRRVRRTLETARRYDSQDKKSVPDWTDSDMSGSQVFQQWSNGVWKDGITKNIHDALATCQSYRWVPAHLGLPTAFAFSSKFGMDPSGFGLPMYLNDILGADHHRFGELEQRFRHLFPQVERLRLEREPAFTSARDNQPGPMGLVIYFELADAGIKLPAAHASDGLLIVLAYLAILYSPDPPRLLLIEEVENGIHPQRLATILEILKQLVNEQKQTQVLLTTHSPYVVDRFKPEEITLCLRGEDGAVTTRRLSESKTVRDQIDIFQLGEIWAAEGDEALAAPAH